MMMMAVYRRGMVVNDSDGEYGANGRVNGV